VLLGVLFVLGASRAPAQIVEDIVADIPYPFHVGSSRFPAGKYILKVPVEFENRVLGVEVVASEDQKAFTKGRTPEEQQVTGSHQKR